MLAAAGAQGPTLHLYRFRPTALIGRHQWIEAELRVDWCRAQGLAVARRLTGGGAFYVDEGQIGFTLAFPRVDADRGTLGELLNRSAAALRLGLLRLGVVSAFKPPNDLEVDGRKLASVFAAISESACLVQGVMLLDVDVARMLYALKVPTEKLSPDGLAGARQRFVTLTELLGAPPEANAVSAAVVHGLALEFGFEPASIVLDSTVDLSALAATVDVELSSDAIGASEAFWPCACGALRARIWFDPMTHTVARAALACDGFVDPADLFERLAAAVRGATATEIRGRVARFFTAEETELVGFGPCDLVKVLELAADRPSQERAFALDPGEANALMVHADDGLEPAAIAAQATVMLVPYCAKLAECKWRQRDGCSGCGLCEVGEAYRLAEARGLRVISIQNYEHLCTTLARLKAEGVPAYIGMCCSQFYLKRHRAFDDARIPAVLMNISGANCYELRVEEQAYAGAFAAKSELNVPLLRKVLGIAGAEAPPSSAR